MLPRSRTPAASSSSASISSPHLYRPRTTSKPYPYTPARRRTKLHAFLSTVFTYVLAFLRSFIPRRPYRQYLTLTTLLLPLWTLLILHSEHWIYTSTAASCDWSTWEDWPDGATPSRVALIADPQLVDIHTYARRGLSLRATIFYTDRYLRRSYNSLNTVLSPSDIFFLGDLFDGGREWRVASYHPPSAPVPADPKGHPDWHNYGHDYWLAEFSRFEHIFATPAGARAHRSLPGNHDLGFGAGVRRDVQNRFEAFFGPPNSLVRVGNHSFVLVDSVSLANDADESVYRAARDFLAALESADHPAIPPAPSNMPHAIQLQTPATHSPPAATHLPTLLLSHVPLHRNPRTPCGPLREKGESIPYFRGYQYQNVLPAPLSQRLLAATKARWVFSGDDHDFCDVTHRYGVGLAREITVKSVSWAMGVRRPGVYLLSLWNPTGEHGGAETVQGRMCYGVDQIGVFLRYAWAALASVVVCWVEVVRRRAGRGAGKGKEKVELPVDTAGKYWRPVERGGGGVRWWGKEVGREVARVGVGVGVVYALVMWWW